MKAALVVLQKRLEGLDAELVAGIDEEVIMPLFVNEVLGADQHDMIDGMSFFVDFAPITAEAIISERQVEG